ncbi:MAG: SDR family oxidoreductase [Chloroflexi bacterium]|uniref:SDR family oxidoreductase n=1 Tax=Candidatus Flexifilum breve TaxID=3140694 RepID=UPI0031356C86|nr:SDR family oxidoreductase [Chloroflexota bacterium]
MSLLAEKVILVTGGASGIGRETALALAREGARVVVSDVNAALGAETAELIQAAGGGAIFVPCDVSKAEQVRALISATDETYGHLDGAFNNAGVGGVMATTADQDETAWDQVININLKGVWLCMKYELPLLLRSGGAIVNTASVAGLVGFPYASAYDASKHGVIGLTKTAALEYAAQNIRVNAICPGFTDTPMVRDMVQVAPHMQRRVTGNPMRRLGTVQEIAETVVWLLSHKASFITGQAIAIDGGLTAG